MPRAHRKLALLGLVAAGLPLVLRGPLWGLEDAFALALVLAGGVVATLWPVLAFDDEVRGGGPRARAVELLLLAASFAPGLRLASMLSRSTEESATRALVGLGVLLVGQGVALAGLARTRLPRPFAVAVFAALGVAAPLAALFAEDAFGSELGLARASIPAALLAQLKGAEDPWGLAVALLALGGISAGVATRFVKGPALVIVALLATPALAGDLELEGTRLVLGPRVRVGELAPLRLKVRASAKGFEGELSVQSGGLAVSVPLKLQGGRSTEVTLPAVGGGSGIKIVARPTRGEPVTLEPPTVQVLDPWVPLVALGPSVPQEIERALRGPAQVREPEDMLDLLARAGALDVVALGRGAPPTLATFAAEGGAIVLPDVATLEALSDGAGPRSDTPLLARRGLGAGTLVAPLTSAGVSALGTALSLHAHTRRDLGAIGRALSEQWRPPGPTARTASQIAWLVVVLLGILVVLLHVPAKEPRGTISYLLVALALTALLPTLVLKNAGAPVYFESATVLEAPSGGSTAGATEVLRFGSPRRIFAEVELAKGPPLAGVFASEGDAARSLTELHEGESAARLKVALGPGHAATFARRSVLPLSGTVTIASGAVTNGLAWRVEKPLLVLVEDGVRVVELPDLAPGATLAAPANPLPLNEFLGRMRAKPTFGVEEQHRLALLTAALHGRGGAGTVRLAGFLSVPSPRKTLKGVLEEAPGEVLLVITRN